MKTTAIIGLGNPLMRDDGVGIRVVERIRDDSRLPADVEVLDLGTGGLTVLHAIEGRSRSSLSAILSRTGLPSYFFQVLPRSLL